MLTETLTLRQQNRATLARQMLLARKPMAPLRAIERLVPEYDNLIVARAMRVARFAESDARTFDVRVDR